jgi:hypothetical protein
LRKLNLFGSSCRNGRPRTALTTLVLTAILSMIVVGAAASGLYVLSTTSQQYPAQQTTLITIGSVKFGPSWHYVGNVTLSGTESVCDILRLPCGGGTPQNPGEELKSTNGTVAYVETANGCGPQGCVITTIVLINYNLFCVSPKSNIPSQAECPGLIN